MSLKNIDEKIADVKKAIIAHSEEVERNNQGIMSDDDFKTHDSLKSELENLTRERETIERKEFASSLAGSASSNSTSSNFNATKKAILTPEDKSMLFRSWALTAAGKSSYVPSKAKELANKLGFDLLSDSIQRDGTLGVTGGSNTMDGAIFAGLEKYIVSFPGMRQVAQVLNSSTSQTWNYPSLDNSSRKAVVRAQLGSMSNTNVSVGASPIAITPKEWYSAVFECPIELLRDSQANVEQIISEALSESINRGQAEQFARGNGSGDGAGGAHGILEEVVQGGTTQATLGELTFPELVKFQGSLDVAHDANASWCMSQATWDYLRSQVDDNNRPVYLESWLGQGVKTLLGKPVTIVSDYYDLDDAGKFSITYGDHSGYLIRDVFGINLTALKELYALNGAVGFMATHCCTGRLINKNKVKGFKNHA